MVGRDDLERCLAQLVASAGDPREGLFGPASATWRVGRESVILLGGGRAALLQLAHPSVAAAVTEHSMVRSNVQERFRRTFVRVFAMLFGDVPSALTAARRVHAVHERVTGVLREDVGNRRAGDSYAANEEDGLFWVLATLVDTAIRVHEDLVGPLGAPDRDAYYQSSKRLGMLFGLEPARLPADYPAFAAYFDGMITSGQVEAGAEGKALADDLLRAPRASLRPFYAFLRAYTAHLLPPALRDGFGLAYGPGERIVAGAGRAAVRATRAQWPAALRYFPAYLDAQRRLAGIEGPDRGGRAATRLVMGLLRSRRDGAASVGSRPQR